MWVLDHLDDLDADFRVFYRIDDPMSLDGPRFFKLAWRCVAYSGVMARRVEKEQEKAEPQRSATGPAQQRNDGERKVVGSTQVELDIAMPGLFEHAIVEG